ncbi:MAG: hypothetical protein WCP96_01485 [Methylococcaceae bacterium]
MNNNIPAQSGQQSTQAPNLDELNKAFAEVTFLWSCLLTHKAEDNPNTANSRFKWLSQEAANLAAVSMQLYSAGETKPSGTKKPA